MPYNLTSIEKPNYLHVKVSGENTAGNIVGYFREVIALCKQKNYAIVLVEDNLNGPSLNMFEIANVITEGTKDAQSMQWIAYVDVNPQHDKAMVEFAGNLAANRGVRMKVFQNVADAEYWLQNTTLRRR